MKYSEVRPLLKTGDLLVWRDYEGGTKRSIITRWLIRHSTASPYIHTGIVWVEHGRVWAIDISPAGCAPRLLSHCAPFDWAPAPRQLSEAALNYAFSRFGYLTYSYWQAVMGLLRRLRIGADDKSQCAEFVLSILRADGMAPSIVATPEACAEGAMQLWGSSLTHVTM